MVFVLMYLIVSVFLEFFFMVSVYVCVSVCVFVCVCPARVWVVLELSALNSSNFWSSLPMNSSILLYCEGTEGEPIEDGVIGRLVIGFTLWLGFGETEMSVGGLGLKLGFGRFRASNRAWVLRMS